MKSKWSVSVGGERCCSWKWAEKGEVCGFQGLTKWLVLLNKTLSIEKEKEKKKKELLA